MALSKEQVIEKLKTFTIEPDSLSNEEKIAIFKWAINEYKNNGIYFVKQLLNSNMQVIGEINLHEIEPLITNSKDVNLINYCMIKIKEFLI
jgi:RimJ/RimL family protein N-acetyltransferase